MTRCEGCEELEKRLEAAEKAIEELRKRGNAFPSEDHITLSVFESGHSYDIPVDGYLVFQAVSTKPGAHISLGELKSMATSLIATAHGQNLWINLEARKGQSVKAKYDLVTYKALYFFPSMGSE